jgi:hypothetical protein
MEGFIRKISVSVFVMIAALAMFTTVAMAWGDGYYRMGDLIQGEYYFVGSGACLLAPLGFNGVLQPITNSEKTGLWNMSNLTWEGVITFKDHHTGTLSGILRQIEQPSFFWFSGPNSDIPDVGAADVSWDFKYKVGPYGRITFTYEKGTYEAKFIYGPMKSPDPLYMTITGPHYGVISPDAKNISFTFGVPLQLIPTADKENTTPVGIQNICNIAMQGFRCLGHCPEAVYSPDPFAP